MNPHYTPKQIVAELDRFIIGQHAAKKAVAIALRNRWRRQQISSQIKEEIMPNNIILIGPTGVGKTEIARRLAKLSNAPFVKVEATKFTEIGYVGKDVESMVRDLAEISFTQVKTEHMSIVQEKAIELAYDRVLDVLIPPISKPKSESYAFGFTDSNADEMPTNDQDLNEKTRSKFREKLSSGELNDRMIEVAITQDKPPMMQVMGASGIDDLNKQIQDMFESFGQNKSKKRKVTVKEAIEIFTQEESQKLIDMDAVKKEAVDRATNNGIIFIDEIDKIAVPNSGSSSGPDVSRAGVQRDLLPIVEGSSVNTKYGVVNTDHVLFIASGAFHMSKPSDLIPELQGRFPIRVELQSLTENDFVNILTKPQNALTRQYTALLEAEGVGLEFTEGGIKAIARVATEVNSEVENIGARRLHTILTTLLEEFMFKIPDEISSGKIEVTAELVEEKLDGIVKNRDLSRYIL